ncbi:GntR family transcriptional regulator [Bordetella genomosp. 8]|uniref:GntR family transcriptional regulator n=1 Tax=Bordetella genomosp. 8 TaxID=1416806 RepID=A0A1W6YET0_9BORD|nr:GntR family transcriptional regulator [Bordetella genomosp. 8]ARP79596.1 GntR family transcriptional regulator [Bordetella genomosp. 8]
MPASAPSFDQPLYEIVRAGIVERLRTGVWAAGDRLPPEPELARLFGVGIGTVRRAVEALVAERLLTRRAGRGTEVARFTDDHAFDLYFNYVDPTGAAIKVTAELLSFARERATARFAALFGIERNGSLAHVENLRRMDGVPVMLDRLWMPLNVFPNLSGQDFAARRGSIYGYYQERYGVSVVRVQEDVTAADADAGVAAAFGLKPGTSVLQVERTAYTFQDKPVEFRRRYVDTRYCAYRNVRGLQD